MLHLINNYFYRYKMIKFKIFEYIQDSILHFHLSTNITIL